MKQPRLRRKTQESCRPGIGISKTAALLRYGQRFGFLVFGARWWLADLAVSVEKSKNRKIEKTSTAAKHILTEGIRGRDQRYRRRGGGFFFHSAGFSLGFFVFSVLIG